MATFKENLHRLRTAAGLSQEELARRLGDITTRTVARYEAGESTPRIPMLLSMADVLGCDVTDLVPEARADG
jgi:transcriptional regulator with XRE-family HTH domain